MTKPTIMVVENDPALRTMITATLDTHSFPYQSVPPEEAGGIDQMSPVPDTVVFDLGLLNKDTDGIALIKKMRSVSSVPIIVLTSRTDVADNIDALDAGADDYLTKPFTVEELLSRVQIAQRRLARVKSAGKDQTKFTNGDLRIDYSVGRVYMSSKQIKDIDLTSVEYQLIVLLAQNIGKVLTYRFLTTSVWGSANDDDIATMRVTMASLRKKIEVDPSDPKYIRAHLGIGYRMLIA